MEQNEAQMVGSLPEANDSKAKTLRLFGGIGCLLGSVLVVWMLWANYSFAKMGRDKGLIVDCYHNIEKVAGALQDYAKDHRGVYPDSLHRLTGGPGQRSYLKQLPTCPAAQRNTFQNYRVSGSSVSFGCCFPHAHADCYPVDFLTYRSQQR